MDPNKFIYPIFWGDLDATRLTLRGNAFAVAPDGGLLTCRHVVDVELSGDESVLFVLDLETGQPVPLEKSVYSGDTNVDLAFLPNALGRKKAEFLPLVTPDILKMGNKLFTFGYYAIGGSVEDLTVSYLRGHIVNMFESPTHGGRTITLPFPVVEGLSGSPVLMQCCGVKAVGVCYGSQEQRIVASEVQEVEEGGVPFKERILRIIEFGLAYHPTAVISFLEELGVEGFEVTDKRVPRKERG